MVDWKTLISECAHLQHVDAVVEWAVQEGAYSRNVRKAEDVKRKELKTKFKALKKEIKACKTLLGGVNHVQLNAAMKKVKSAPYLDADQKKELLELIERIFLSVKQNRIANKGAQFAAKVKADIQALRDQENAELEKFKEAHGLA